MKKDDAIGLCDKVRDLVGDHGWALFVEGDDEIGYMSNCERDDVVKTMEEWLEKTKGVPVPKHLVPAVTKFVASKRDLDPFAGYERIKLERLCISVGVELEDFGKICLFVFDMGEGGNMAYHTNMAYARSRVAAWVDSVYTRAGGRSPHSGRARHFYRDDDGQIKPLCYMCRDNSQLGQATRFDEDTKNEYICQRVMES